MSDIVLPRRPDPWRLAIAPAFCVCLAIAVGALALARIEQAGPVLPPAAAVPSSATASPRWLEIPRPVHIYSLESPELRRAPLVYSARRLSQGDVREDRLAFGAAASGTLVLRLSILRGATAAPRSLGEALPALLEAEGLKARLGGAPNPLATRFGAFEVASASLEGDTGTACDAFRLTSREPALIVTGIGCSRATAPLPRAALACLIDRLDLASAGEDRALVTLFAAAELRRNPDCRGMRLGPDGLHAPWLDDKPATPPVKTRRHARLMAPTQGA